MKKTWITTSAVAAISFAVAWMASKSDPSESGEIRSSRPPARSPEGASPSTDRLQNSRIPVHGRSSDDYRIAWEELASRRLSRSARQQVQKEIFEAWANIDLEAAIGAALSEPWDEGSMLCSQVMVDRSEDVWRLIQEDRFGPLAGALLRKAWANSLASVDPTMLIGYLPELKGIDLRNTVQSMVQQLNEKDDAIKAWQALVSRNDLSPDDRRLLGDVMGTLGKFFQDDDLREMMKSGDSLSANAAAQTLVSKLKHGHHTTDLQHELDAAPEGLRNAMAAEWLSGQYSESGESTLAALNHLISNNQWSYLAAGEVSMKMVSLASQIGKPELASWVADLPPREETIEIFHRGVEPFIQQDKEAAWQWMSGLEEGTWRDRAFAEYSQQMLNRHNDPDASLKALDQIQDPAFKATAKGWRSDWELRTGKQ